LAIADIFLTEQRESKLTMSRPLGECASFL